MRKNSKNRLILLASVAAIAAVSYFVVNSDKTPEGDVVATINGKPVYSSEANNQLSALLRNRGANVKASFSSLDESAKYIIIRDLAAQKLVVEEAYDEGVDSASEFKEKLAKIKDQLAKEEFLAAKAKDSITEEKLKAKYDELVKDLEGKTQYKARHILVKTEKEANSLKNSLRKTSFEKLAMEKSIDPNTAQDGGNLGYLLSGDMVKEVEDVISKLKEGEVSKPFKTALGWHVLKLEEKRPAEADPFEAVKGKIAQSLASAKITQYMKELVDNAEIELIGSEPEAAAESNDVSQESDKG